MPLLLWDTATGRDRLLGTLGRPDIGAGGGRGLTVSVDGSVILCSKMIGEGSDLVLIENFR